MASFEQPDSEQTGHPQQYNLWLSGLICVVASLFFLYEFVLQVAPNVMTSELMRDFHIDAAGVGIISGAYYISYTAMQIPAGLLYDRFGPHLLLTFATLICALGAFAFGLTSSVVAASAGRVLMGVGSAFAFLGCLVLVSRWFPAKYFAMMAGIVQLMSSIGALTGEAPLAAAIAEYGWREVMIWIAVTGLVIALAIWTIVRDSPASINRRNQRTKKGELKRLGLLTKHSQTWFVGIYAFTAWAPILVFAALWGVPYLTSAYGISDTKAASAISMVWIAIGVGSPFIGWLSDRIGRRIFPLAMCSALGLASSLIILYVPNIPFSLMFPLLFVFGFAASAQILSFALIKDNNPPGMVGTAIGINNTFVVCGGILFQPLVGFLLRINWSGGMKDNIPFYAAGDYSLALSILPICFALGFVLSLFALRESYCRPNYHYGEHHHH